MRMRVRPNAIDLLLVIFISILWLFSPRPTSPGDYCGHYVSINSRMGFVVNCDAGTYAAPAERPARLMQSQEVRQSRPLYVLLGTIIGYPLGGLARLFVPGIDPRTPFHVGFAMLNLVLLASSVLLFDALLSSAGVDRLVIIPLAVFLIANDVTKAFVWTAHQQMFSLFTPLVALYLYQRIAGSPALPRLRFWALSLALGLLPLVYGNFLVILPTLLVADALATGWNRGGKFAGMVSRFGLAIVAFLLPTIAWIALVTWRSGSYYNHEMVVYRQLIWMADAAQTGVGGFLRTAAHNTRSFAATFVTPEMLPFLGVCVLIPLSRTMRPADPRPAPFGIDRRIDARACLVVDAVFFLFLWALGYYQTRLTYSLIPPALCLGAMEMSRMTGTNGLSNRRLAWILAPLACIWTAYHVMKYGPFG